MKKIGNVLYGLAVLWLLFISITYGVTVFYCGLEEIRGFSIDSGTLFVTMICVIILLIVHPIRNIVKNVIKELDRSCKRGKAKKINATGWKQKKTA